MKLFNPFFSYLLLTIFALSTLSVSAQKKKNKKKPNIIVLWGDDIGLYNISFWNRGIMGYQTPNIDRIANQGVSFTDYYGEQSCTAGRSSFITGQDGLRTGMTKVGLPNSPDGQAADDITIAEALKNHGYATGQFGKNHLGDLDKHLPTNHGFDEFYGILYHLNALQEPEDVDYPKDEEFIKKYGPRGVVSSSADGKIEDLGPLTITRMQNFDNEVNEKAQAFIKKAVDQEEPFFVWWNSTRMHMFTHLDNNARGLSGQGYYNDGMVEHDQQVGEMLKFLEDNDLMDNTIIVYGTDNGPHYNMWPDGAITPFRSEKETNWEGAYRVPCHVLWKDGGIEGGKILNGMTSHLDFFPTLLAAAGESDVKEKLLNGQYEANDKTFKVHLDGYNMLDYWQGKAQESPRKEFIYYNADAQVVAIRYEQTDYQVGASTGNFTGGVPGNTPKTSPKGTSTAWKVVYGEQREKTMKLWAEPFTWLRLPKIFNLNRDPFERADTDSDAYWNWHMNHVFIFYKANELVVEHLKTYKMYPPSQRPGSFTMDSAAENVYKTFGVGPGDSTGKGIE